MNSELSTLSKYSHIADLGFCSYGKSCSFNGFFYADNADDADSSVLERLRTAMRIDCIFSYGQFVSNGKIYVQSASMVANMMDLFPPLKSSPINMSEHEFLL